MDLANRFLDLNVGRRHLPRHFLDLHLRHMAHYLLGLKVRHLNNSLDCLNLWHLHDLLPRLSVNLGHFTDHLLDMRNGYVTNRFPPL